MSVSTFVALRHSLFSNRATHRASFESSALKAASVAALAACLCPFAAQAQLADAPSLDSLDQRIRILERQLELAREEQAAAAQKTAKVSVGEKGLSVESADGAYGLKIRGTFHTDGRFFIDDDDAFSDAFLVRRLYVDLQGSLGKWVAYRVMPDFGASTSIVDAYFDLKFSPAATLRVGRQITPLSLDRAQSSQSTPFIERGATYELAPQRDVGITLQGALFSEAINYQFGLYNGTPDGRDTAASNDADHFETAGRLFLTPFKSRPSLLQGFGIGIAGSTGKVEGTGTDFLPRYRTPGQNTFFSYRGASTESTGVFADGRHTRIAPQAYLYVGRVGVMGEWLRSSQHFTIDGTSTRLDNEAWQVFASWVLTGEDASYGSVKPASPFAPGGPGWGALELVLGAGEIDIDDDAFPLYASADSAATKASSLSAGLNWHLTTNLKVSADYRVTQFDGGAPEGADRRDEQALFTRLQVAF